MINQKIPEYVKVSNKEVSSLLTKIEERTSDITHSTYDLNNIIFDIINYRYGIT